MTVHAPSIPRPQMLDSRPPAHQQSERVHEVASHSVCGEDWFITRGAQDRQPGAPSKNSLERMVPPSAQQQSEYGHEVSALRAALVASETALSRAARDLAAERKALSEECLRSEVLEARVRSLECAMASATSRHILTSREDSALEDERLHSAIIAQQVVRLEGAMREAAMREADLAGQLEVMRRQCDYHEFYQAAEAARMGSRYIDRLPVDLGKPWYQPSYSSYSSISAAVAPLTSLTSLQSSGIDCPRESVVEDLRSLVLSVRRKQDELSALLPQEEGMPGTGSAPERS